MNTTLPLDNAGLVLVAINNEAVKTPPSESISLLKVISVLPSKAVNFAGATVNTLKVTVAGTKLTPDTYDFEATGETTATATAGATAAGSATADDEWTITVNGVAYTVTTTGGETPAQVRTAMTALLTANTQGFTVSSTLIGSAILYTLTGPTNSSGWDGYVVTSTFPTNTGPTFSVAVNTNFSGGSGIAEQFQAFLTAQGLTSTLPIITGLLVNGVTSVKNEPSFMLNATWIDSSAYDDVSTTTIVYKAPLGQTTTFKVRGNQTSLPNTFNV